MQRVIITNKARPAAPAIAATYCNTFLCQLRGLTFRRSIAEHEGLLLVQKRDSKMDATIHMLFVWMDLAVVWINTAGEVVDVQLAHRWHPYYAPRKPARYILEMHADRIGDYQIGDQVEIGNIQAV